MKRVLSPALILMLAAGGALAAEPGPEKQGKASVSPAGGVAAGGAPTGAEALASKSALPPPFRWDVPKVVEQIPIPGKQMSRGIPVEMHAVRSTMRLESLYAHFQKLFLDAKLYVPPHSHINLPIREANLTGLDVFRSISYTVILQEQPDGSVICMLTESNLSRREKVSNAFAPVHPGASAPLITVVEGNRALGYTVDVSVDEVLAFYRRKLGERGFKEVGPMRFRNGSQLWWVQAERVDGKTHVSVLDSPHLLTDELQTAQ